MFKKLMSSMLVVVFVIAMLVPTYAATGYSSGSTKVMNSLNGIQSAKSPITCSPYDSNAKTSSVEVNVTVSSGSSPFYIIIESPDGTAKREKLITSSTKFTITDLTTTDAAGKWQVSIRTQGTQNVVSTATATVKVNYTY